MKQIGAGLLLLFIVALGSPVYAACPSAGSLTVSTLSGLVGQIWVSAGQSFTISPMTNGASIWYATPDGAADTFLIIINQSGGSLMPHVAISDLDGQELTGADVTIDGKHTFTLSVASAIAVLCQ